MRSIALTLTVCLLAVAPAPAAMADAPQVKDCKTVADGEKKTCLQDNIKALRKSLNAAITDKCKADSEKAGQTGAALSLATMTCTEAKLQDLYKGASQ
ncbi:MAG: hypothetical protein U1E49_19390 [Hyphomicrobiaceae bacterium]